MLSKLFSLAGAAFGSAFAVNIADKAFTWSPTSY
jgi:hypothetical protein